MNGPTVYYYHPKRSSNCFQPCSGTSRLPTGWHDWAALPSAADTQTYFHGTRPATASGLFKKIGGITVLPGILESDDEIIYPEAVECALAHIAHAQTNNTTLPRPYGWDVWAASNRASGARAFFCGTKGMSWTGLLKKPELSGELYKADIVPRPVHDIHQYASVTKETIEFKDRDNLTYVDIKIKEFDNISKPASPSDVSRVQSKTSLDSRQSSLSSYSTCSGSTTTSSDGSTEDEDSEDADYLEDVHIDTIDDQDITIVRDAKLKPILLGEGGFGKVYLGQLGNTKVVIKKIRVVIMAREEVINEAKLQKLLEAANIVPKVLGVSYTLNSTSIIQEYIEDSVTLERVVKSLSTAQWFDVLVKTAEAIRLMHNLEVIHNDLKEDNILLQRKRDGLRVILIDFGLASYREGQQSAEFNSDVNLDHYSHLAPEVFAGHETTTASDIYSFGNIMRESKIRNDLGIVVNQCLDTEDTDRPEIDEVINELKFSELSSKFEKMTI